MSNNMCEFTTYSAPGENPFAGKVDEATEYYRKVFYGDEHYYGPAIDATLHEAVRECLVEDGSVSIEGLCEQLGGPHPSEFDITVAEGLRDLIWEASPLSSDAGGVGE